VLPIIIMALVSGFGNNGTLALVSHLSMIWAYESFFAFISYTSTDWGSMACLVAGFGCSALIGTRTTIWNPSLFQTQYMEIGQVTACIIVQMIVDVIDSTLRKRWPRDVIVTNMAKLGMTVDDETAMQWDANDTLQHLASSDLEGAIVKAFEHFMGLNDKSMTEMLKCIEHAKKLTAKQESLVYECRPRSVVVRGPRTPFKVTAGQEALMWIKKLLQEMELLYMVYKRGPRSAGTPEPQFVHNLHLDTEYQKDILMTMRLTLMDLQMVFKHDKDGFIHRPYKANPKIADPDMNWRVRSDSVVARSPKDFRRDLCVCVAQRALFDSLSHLSELQHVCYATGGFAYEMCGV